MSYMDPDDDDDDMLFQLTLTLIVSAILLWGSLVSGGLG